MKILKQETYFPIIVGIHLIFWAIDLYFFQGNFVEKSSDTLFFGEYTNTTGVNHWRVIGEIFSSWVVTVFAFNFLMATRAKWVERIFGGLDKMYLIHRRSGVIAVILLIAHFITVPRDLTAFSPGKPLGFYALALILIGVILSAVPYFKKKIPYHKWLNVHKLMGVFYVMGVIHGFMVFSLIKELPITRIYVFGMSILGVMAWFYRAFLYDIFNKKLSYSITKVNSLGNKITEIQLAANGDPLLFKAGQFAFFKFLSINKREQHPFTISSHPSEPGLRITIKDLGDYSAKTAEVREGEEVLVEGPFGHFTNDNIKDNKQIWIAGGIGITPFLSLAREIKDQRVNLFWCVNSVEEAVYARELAVIASDNENFNFTVWDSSTRGHISAEAFSIKNYTEYSYLICGPEALKNALFKQLKSKGVNQFKIIDEEFAFR